MIEQLDFLKGFTYQMTPVGSRVTCNPAPTNTDYDVLVFIGDNWDFIEGVLYSHDFKHDGSEKYETPNGSDFQFRSYSRGELNLIVTSSELFYKKFLAASSIAKRLNLLNKHDRIALFEAVLYDLVDNSWLCTLPSVPYPLQR